MINYRPYSSILSDFYVAYQGENTLVRYNNKTQTWTWSDNSGDLDPKQIQHLSLPRVLADFEERIKKLEEKT